MNFFVCRRYIADEAAPLLFKGAASIQGGGLYSRGRALFKGADSIQGGGLYSRGRTLFKGADSIQGGGLYSRGRTLFKGADSIQGRLLFKGGFYKSDRKTANHEVSGYDQILLLMSILNLSYIRNEEIPLRMMENVRSLELTNEFLEKQ